MFRKLLVPTLSLFLFFPLFSTSSIDAETIRGRLLDVDGAPLVEAHVVVRPLFTEFQDAAMRLYDLGERSYGTDFAATDGSFSVELFESGFYVLEVRRNGYHGGLYSRRVLTPQSMPTRFLEPFPATPWDLVLVKVVDTSGNHIRDAEARISFADLIDGDDAFKDRLYTPTYVRPVSTQGRLQARRFVGEALEISIRHPDYPPATKARVVGDETIVLRPGVPRTVRVLRVGVPVPKAIVTVEGWPVCSTDDDGSCRVLASTEEDLKLRVLDQFGAEAEAVLPAIPAGPNGAPEGEVGGSIELSLTTPPQVRGIVRDARTDHPIAGAWVWLSQAPAQNIRTNERGVFSLPVPDRVRARNFVLLFATAPGYDRQVLRLDSSELGRTIQPEYVVALPELDTLAGRVVDAQGRPIPNASLNAGSGLARSEFDGHFFLQIRPETEYVSIDHPDYLGRDVQITPREGTAPDGESSRTRPEQTFVLTSGSSLSGVVHAAGEPAAGVAVSLRKIENGRSRSRGRESPSTTTDDEGGFLFERLPDGVWEWNAETPGFAPKRIPGVILRPDAAEDLGAIELRPGVAISGRVVDENDRPVADLQVRLLDETLLALALDSHFSNAELATTDAEGRFTFVDAAPGAAFAVQAGGTDGWAPTRSPVFEVPTEEDPVLVVHPFSGARVRVVDENGSPISQARIMFQRMKTFGGSSGRGGQSDAQGLFETDALISGKYVIRGEHRDFLPAVLDTEIGPGEFVDDLRLVLRRGAELSGRVLDENGLPITEARVEAFSEVGRLARRPVKTDQDGAYRLDNLPLETIRLSARARDRITWKGEVFIRSPRQSFDIVLRRGVLVRGRVFSPDGEPAEAAQVSLRPEPPSGENASTPPPLFASTTPRGEFTVHNVPDGVYDLVARHERFGDSEPAKIQIIGATREDLAIFLEPGVALSGSVSGYEDGAWSNIQVVLLGRSRSSYDAYARKRFLAEDGSYRFESLAPGDYVVEAQDFRDERVVRKKTTIPEDADEIRLDLEFEPGVELTGVALVDGEPRSMYLEAFHLETGTRHQEYSRADGRFRFQDLPRGAAVLITSDARSALRYHQRVELEHSQELEIDLQTGILVLLVKDASTGLPIAQAGVTLRPSPAGLEAEPRGRGLRHSTNSTGGVRIAPIVAGEWTVSVARTGFRAVREKVVVEPRAQKVVQIDLVRGDSVP